MGTLLLDELFLSTSLKAIESYYVKHNSFPMEWLGMQAFLKKVFPVSYFLLLHDVTVIEINIQHKSNKARAFRGVQDASVGVDLMIMDIPEGLHVPMVSSPTSSIPEWNKHGDGFLQIVFYFASGLIHDNGVLLLFYLDNLHMRADIRGYMKAYHFSLFKEFMGVNCLQLTIARNASKIVSELCILKFTMVIDTYFIDLSITNCIHCFIHL